MSFIERLINALTKTHPFHPMFVHFPIGLFGGALFFTLLWLWKRKKVYEQIAFANLVLGMMGTFVAGLVGMSDNLTRYQGAAPNAGWKIALAVLLFLASLAAVLLRWRMPRLLEKPLARRLYIAAYFVYFPLTIVLGFLGGVILYGF
jgi:uncharacterized membrane protein